MERSKEMQDYFDKLNKGLYDALDKANKAREKFIDPEQKVDIPIARNMAERVEGLISAVAPQLVGSGITDRIVALEKVYGVSAWEVALLISEEVANEKFCKFKDKREAMEVAIRTGMAYNTNGIVAAPLEGFIELKVKKRKDSEEYLSLSYAGPIRGAGGTAAAFSVILGDYIRKKMGYKEFDPQDEEVERYVTEVRDYHERVTNLQYNPSEDEIRFLAKHIPIEVNGDPTEKITVSNHKNLERVETDLIRGGVCLVLAEGVAQKAPKLWKRLSKWGKKFGLDWEFLAEFLELQKIKKSQKKTKQKTDQITPNLTYIKDLVAGRPVLSFPMQEGGFRLRYGRARTSGYSAACIHPATMALLNKYIAVGTQLKVERPGKAAAIASCDDIDGPIVRTKDQRVIRLRKESQAKSISNDVEEILFLGDILFNYGDFSENGHRLVPAGYCEEWWALEAEKAIVDIFGSLDFTKLAEETQIEQQRAELIIKDPLHTKIKIEEAITLSKSLKIPLHPDFIFYYRSLNKEQIASFGSYLHSANIVKENNVVKKLILKNREEKRFFDIIGCESQLVANEYLVIEGEDAAALYETFRLYEKPQMQHGETTLSMINSISPFKIRDKCGTFIGARMGRPEKAKMRKLIGSPQMLFPVGKEGGRMRSLQSALSEGKITADLPVFVCTDCKRECIGHICEVCGMKTLRRYHCKVCGITERQECQHGKTSTHRIKQIDIKQHFNMALSSLNIKNYPDLIKGVKGNMNKDRIAEPLGKGVLRAMHSIYVNKDGTTRYDMTELPITHFKPHEIGTSIKKLIEIGYTKDIKGKDLVTEDQILELKPQDVILPSSETSTEESADDVLLRVCNFVDDGLIKLYGKEPFYNLKTKHDLIGHLVIGLAPHTSAGMVGRIIGFSKTQGCLAHPLWHAALRRDCDGDEACVMMLMDAFLNFSRQFLPDRRGARTMDAPLVLTTEVIPSEVDSMAHGLDVVWRYPLEFYQAAEEYKSTGEVQIEQLGNNLNKEKQYEGMGFTHDVSDINSGVLFSAYKSLPSMEDKLKGQMELAEKIRAVEEGDVAKMVIEKHFLKDIKGNLRKFFHQQFRCVSCNEKYRRPPLAGKCTACSGKLLLTISEGSIVKYLDPSLSLSRKYDVPVYLKQTLELTERMVIDVFGKEKEKQTGLGNWFG